MQEIKVFHYTDFSKLGSVLGDFVEPGRQPGLELGTAIGRVSYPAASTRAVYCLLEPTPDNWVSNPNFPVTWRNLVRNIGIMDYGKWLLEVGVNFQRDRVLVGDRGHFEGVLCSEEDETAVNTPTQYRHPGLKVAEQAFMTSLIPLADYLDKSDKGAVSYSLPEVLIMDPVPVERIKISEQQPLIEEDLAKPFGQEELIYRILRVSEVKSELASWKEKYEAINGSLKERYERSIRS
jgi:hypothetical protein